MISSFTMNIFWIFFHICNTTLFNYTITFRNNTTTSTTTSTTSTTTNTPNKTKAQELLFTSTKHSSFIETSWEMLMGNYGGNDSEILFLLYQENKSEPIARFSTTIRELSFFTEPGAAIFRFIPKKKRGSNYGTMPGGNTKIGSFPVLEILEFSRKEAVEGFVTPRPNFDNVSSMGLTGLGFTLNSKKQKL